MSMFRERDAARRRHQADVGAVRHERKKLKEAGEYVPGIAHHDDIQAAARARSGFTDNATAAAGGAAGSIDHSAGKRQQASPQGAPGANDANLQGRLSLFDEMKKAGAGANSSSFRERASSLGIDNDGFNRGLNRAGEEVRNSLASDASNRPQVDIGAPEVTQEMRDQAKNDPAGMETLDLEAVEAESSAPSLVAESAQPAKELYRDADGKTDRMRGIEEMYGAPKEDALVEDAKPTGIPRDRATETPVTVEEQSELDHLSDTYGKDTSFAGIAEKMKQERYDFESEIQDIRDVGEENANQTEVNNRQINQRRAAKRATTISQQRIDSKKSQDNLDALADDSLASKVEQLKADLARNDPKKMGGIKLRARAKHANVRQDIYKR